jgi:hypothetical protein
MYTSFCTSFSVWDKPQGSQIQPSIILSFIEQWLNGHSKLRQGRKPLTLSELPFHLGEIDKDGFSLTYAPSLFDKSQCTGITFLHKGEHPGERWKVYVLIAAQKGKTVFSLLIDHTQGTTASQRTPVMPPRFLSELQRNFALGDYYLHHGPKARFPTVKTALLNLKNANREVPILLICYPNSGRAGNTKQIEHPANQGLIRRIRSYLSNRFIKNSAFEANDKLGSAIPKHLSYYLDVHRLQQDFSFSARIFLVREEDRDELNKKLPKRFAMRPGQWRLFLPGVSIRNCKESDVVSVSPKPNFEPFIHHLKEKIKQHYIAGLSNKHWFSQTEYSRHQHDELQGLRCELEKARQEVATWQTLAAGEEETADCRARESDELRTIVNNLQCIVSQRLDYNSKKQHYTIPTRLGGKPLFCTSDFEYSPEEPPEEDRVNSATEALNLAIDRFGVKGLAASKQAFRMAKKCKFKDSQLIYEMLEFLATTYISVRRSNPGMPLEDYFNSQESAFKHAKGVVKSTLSYDDRYYLSDKQFLPDNLSKVAADEHLTKGTAWSERDCLRIYWWFDSNNNRVVINAIGPHLKNRSSK